MDAKTLIERARAIDLEQDERFKRFPCRGGKSGRKIHLGHAGSSTLECGHWTGTQVSNFRVRMTVEDVVRTISGKNLCEKCFSWAISQEARQTHDKAVCERSDRPMEYNYKSWTAEFICPVCERRGKFNKNFLGRRLVVCDGARFRTERRPEE